MGELRIEHLQYALCTLSIIAPCEVGIFYYQSHSQMRKLRLREMKWPSKDLKSSDGRAGMGTWGFSDSQSRDHSQYALLPNTWAWAVPLGGAEVTHLVPARYFPSPPKSF